MKNATKTFLFTTVTSICAVVLGAYIQVRGQSTLKQPASYLDPFLIDILAFAVAAFLLAEGITRLRSNMNAPLKSQVTRSLRVAVACAIITIHTIQFIHK